MKEPTFKELKLDFLIKQVFGNNSKSEEAYIDSAINRAYLDFNRTIHGYSKSKSSKLQVEMIGIIKQMVSDFRSNEYEVSTFDIKHDSYCNALLQIFNSTHSTGKPVLMYGQAQKWVNMTLKYLMTLTVVCPSLSDIETNYKLFHVPIDSYLLKHLGITSMPSWSRINRNAYLEYQLRYKTKYQGEIPIITEFEFWNNYVTNPKNDYTL